MSLLKQLMQNDSATRQLLTKIMPKQAGDGSAPAD